MKDLSFHDKINSMELFGVCSRKFYNSSDWYSGALMWDNEHKQVVIVFSSTIMDEVVLGYNANSLDEAKALYNPETTSEPTILNYYFSGIKIF